MIINLRTPRRPVRRITGRRIEIDRYTALGFFKTHIVPFDTRLIDNITTTFTTTSLKYKWLNGFQVKCLSGYILQSIQSIVPPKRPNCPPLPSQLPSLLAVFLPHQRDKNRTDNECLQYIFSLPGNLQLTNVVQSVFAGIAEIKLNYAERPL